MERLMKQYKIIVPITGEAVLYMDSPSKPNREEVSRIVKEASKSDFTDIDWLEADMGEEEFEVFEI